jgi:hypothetical protein
METPAETYTAICDLVASYGSITEVTARKLVPPKYDNQVKNAYCQIRKGVDNIVKRNVGIVASTVWLELHDHFTHG